MHYFKLVHVKQHYPNYGPQTKFIKSICKLPTLSSETLDSLFCCKQFLDSTTQRFIDVVYINYEQELSTKNLWYTTHASHLVVILLVT